MRCAQVRDCFDALFDGRLGEEERRQADRHLAACPQCAAEYATMRRILTGIRKIPRPRAPVLEVSPPPGRTLVMTEYRDRRRWLLRAAAAILLLALLGFSHALAFHLGERKHEDLAEIGRRELPRAFANYLDEAESQVQFARQLAKDDPTAVPRLVFDDELGRKHQAMSQALLRVSDQPTLRPVQAKFATFVRRQNELYSTRRPGALSRRLAGVEEELDRLRRELDRLHVGVVPAPPASDDEESLVRQNWRLLRDRRAGAVVKSLATFTNRHPSVRFGNAHLYFLAESSLMLGEIPDMSTVQLLLRREGDRGVETFFGPLIRQVKSGGRWSSRRMISIGLGRDPSGPLIRIQGAEHGHAGIQFHVISKTLGPGLPVDWTGFIDTLRWIKIPKRD